MASQVITQRQKLLDEARVPNLTREEREEVAALLARLEAECADDVQRVILYGSKARGTADEESDVDLLIAASNGVECVERVVKELQQNLDFRLNPLILSGEDYDYHKRLLPPLYVNVRREGIELWDVTTAETEEREVPLDFVEGEFRAMNEPTRELVKLYWQDTQFFWRDAMQLKAAGSLRGAVSRAFYAVFHAVSAALYTLNVVRGKHSAVEAAIHAYLIQPGLLEPEYGAMYTNLMRGRQIADYGSIRKPGALPRFEKLSDEEMNQMLADAAKFIARMERFLRERGAIE